MKGEDSLPSIEDNFIKLCLASAIVIDRGVTAIINKNNLHLNSAGIVVINSKSTVYENKIKKIAWRRNTGEVYWTGKCLLFINQK